MTVLMYAKPFSSSFSVHAVSFAPTTRRDGFLREREFLSAVSVRVIPITDIIVKVPRDTKPVPLMGDFGYGIFSEAVEIDHTSLYPSIIVNGFETITRGVETETFFTVVNGEDFIDYVTSAYKKLMEIKNRLNGNEYMIVAPMVKSDFAKAYVIGETFHIKSSRLRKIMLEHSEDEPLKSLDEAIEVARDWGVSATIFRLRDFVKGVMLTRFGLMKYHEPTLFNATLIIARKLAVEVLEYALMNEIPVLRVYVDAYTILGTESDAEKMLRCPVFRYYPAKVEASGTLYHYHPAVYSIVGDNGCIKKFGVWIVFAMEPKRKYRFRDVQIDFGYSEVPKALAYRWAWLRDTEHVISVFRRNLVRWKRDIEVEYNEDGMVRMRPKSTEINDTFTEFSVPKNTLTFFARKISAHAVA